MATVQRPQWDTYFMEITTTIAKRSTCMRRKVGAILVKDKRILATGYNGAPVGLAHCDEVGCVRQQYQIPSGEKHELCRGLHAEQNAIIQAAIAGVSIAGSSLYVTTFPCALCAKMLLNAQVKQVIYNSDYRDELALKLFNEANIDISRYSYLSKT